MPRTTKQMADNLMSIVDAKRKDYCSVDEETTSKGLKEALEKFVTKYPRHIAYIKNTSYGYHKGESVIISNTARDYSGKDDYVEIYVTDCNETLRYSPKGNVRMEFSIKATPEAMRMFDHLPSVKKILKLEDGQKAQGQMKRALNNTKLTDEELKKRLDAILISYAY